MSKQTRLFLNTNLQKKFNAALREKGTTSRYIHKMILKDPFSFIEMISDVIVENYSAEDLEDEDDYCSIKDEKIMYEEILKYGTR